MFKRLAALFAAALLLISFAVAEDTFGLTGVHIYGTDFAINYPPAWGVSTDDSENTPDDLYCGMLFSPDDTGLNVEIYKYYLADWADYTMLDMDTEGIAGFHDMLMAMYGETMQYQPLDTLYTTRDGIPFLTYNAADEYGPMFVAESMLDGWFITIYGYGYADASYTLCRTLTDDDLALFNAIVQTYAPMNITQPAK